MVGLVSLRACGKHTIPEERDFLVPEKIGNLDEIGRVLGNQSG